MQLSSLHSGCISRDRRRRVLFISPWNPRAHASGGQIVSDGLLRLYASQCDVDVIFGSSSPDAMFAPLPGVRVVDVVPLRLQFGAHRAYSAAMALLSWSRGRSMREAKMSTRAMRAAVHRALRSTNYDFVHVDLTLLAAAVPSSCRLVVSAQNVEAEVMERLAASSSSVLRRIAAAVEARTTVQAERRALERACAVITMNDRDAQLLCTRYEADPAKLHPVYPFVEAAPDASLSGRTTSVLLLGSMAAPQRAEGVRWFIDRVWPLVKQTCRDAVLEVVGAHPPADILRRASADVRVRGFLENIEELQALSRVVVVPLFAGGGIRVKTIESLAWGIPVVSTAVGAVGLREDSFDYVDIADEPGDMADSVVRWLTNDAAWIRRSREGQRHVRACYSQVRAREALSAVIASTGEWGANG